MLKSNLGTFALLAVSLLCVDTPGRAQSSVEPVTSPQGEIKYAHTAATDPLNNLASAQRKAAMTFVENDHQTHVLLCSQLFQEMQSNHAAGAHEITIQYLVSAAAFLYEHPEAVTDSLAQNVAGLEGALDVYDNFLAKDPKSHSNFLDELAKKRAQGKLKDELARQCK